MLKFFRKYNKVILGVGFAFLMVVFLLPTGVSQLVGDPRNRPAFTYDGGVVTQGELIQATQELRFLERLHPVFLNVLLGVDGSEHWVLLTREAQAGGFVGGPEDGRNSLSQLAETFADFELNQAFRGDISQILSLRDGVRQQMYTHLEAQRAAEINSGQPPEIVDRVLAKARGVVRLYTNYLNTQTLSGPELLVAAQDSISSAIVQYALISSGNLVTPETPEPGEEEILDHFEAYGNVAPGEGEYGFGYLREPAVRLEWMIVSRDEISRVVKVDPVDVHVHWQTNREQFGANFEEARPKVENVLREQLIERIFSTIRQVVKGQFLQAAGGLEEGSFGRKILPDDWESRRPSFGSIAQRVSQAVQEQLGIEIVPPDTINNPLWLTRSTVEALPVIGQSRIDLGRTSRSLADLVFSVPEIGNDETLRVQTGLAYPDPLRATSGSLCYFRVLAARPQSPPDSVGEVRSRIVNNLKRLSVYRGLVDRQSEILNEILEKGIEEGIRPYEVNIILTDVSITKNQTSRRIAGSPDDVQALRNAILAQAGRIDQTVPIEDVPLVDRVTVTPMPSVLSLAAAEITRVAPVSQETFQNVAPQILTNTRASLRREHAWPFTIGEMRLRHKVRIVGQNQADDGDPDSETTNVTPGAAPAGTP